MASTFPHKSRRPRACGDPYAVSSRWGTVGETFCNYQSRWLWVPAFAGTTGGEMRLRHSGRCFVLPRPALRGERVGVRGSCHAFGRAEHPPHPKPSASTSPRKRGEARKRRLSMNREAAAYRVARSRRAMTAEFDVTDCASGRRPRARGDPYAVSSRWGTVGETFCNYQSRWLWVPAFAGTTGGEMRLRHSGRCFVLPRPALRGERVGVRGSFHAFGRAESPPHPKPSASTSPRQRGEARKRRLSMNRGAAACRVARSRQAMTAEFDVVAPGRRPRARGDPYAVYFRHGTRLETFHSHEGRWLWVPAFAGT